mgnify:CR=1 FL=1
MTEFFSNVDWQGLLQTYGYWAILLGTFLEGETIVLLAGICVAGGQMSFEGVAACAFLGSVVSDQLMFSIGKYKGEALLARFPRLNRNREKAAELLRKYDILLILGFRFAYGLRNITPIILGLGGIRHWRFLVLNLTGALIWAVSFTAAGYYFGHAIDRLLRALGFSAPFAIAGIILISAVTLFGIRRWRKRRAQATIVNSGK